MKKLIIALTSIFISCTAYSVDLMTVYQHALENDPLYQAARTEYLAAAEELPKSMSLILPIIGVSGNSTNARIGGTLLSGTHTRHSNRMDLQLQQPIFNVANWETISGAKATTKQAYANYIIAEQNLTLRTSRAYFAVLETIDNLKFNQAEEAALKQQLEQTEQRFKVGLDPITNVYDAKARYLGTVSRVIAAKNDIANRIEDLYRITRRRYKRIAPLKGDVPLKRPVPDSKDTWVTITREHNLDILAQKWGVEAAKSNIYFQKAGHYPTIDATATYNRDLLGRVAKLPKLLRRTHSITVGFNFPVFQGGFVNSSVRQAGYNYETALHDLERIFRLAFTVTRQNFNNVTSLISQVKADRQAVISNESSVKSNQEAFKVGTRTIVDVLDAVQRLTLAQKVNAADQYDYIDSILTLKRAAGILTGDDLKPFDEILNRKKQVDVGKYS